MAGVLPDWHIAELLEKGFVDLECGGSPELLQPASLDLPVGKKVYLIDKKFVPFGARVRDMLEDYKVLEMDISTGSAVLYKGQTYLVPVGWVKLPMGIVARISPKSSIGRIDMLVRAIVDRVGVYDFVPEGAEGELWLQITPQSFNVEIRCGLPLTQMMFLDLNFSPSQSAKASWQQFESQFLKVGDDLVFRIDLDGDVPGYKSVYTAKIIDLSKKNFYSPRDFFKPVKLEPDQKVKKVFLRPGDFYIFKTKEVIKVPPNLALEWLPFSSGIGDIRVHYAGFFDPGFEGKGVLEVRSWEPAYLYDGHPIGVLKAYFLKDLPKRLYGETGSNYQHQD